MSAASKITHERITTARGKRRGNVEGVGILHSVFAPGGQPVIGLYVYLASRELLKSLSIKEFEAIQPHLLGTPAVLSKHPGLSQSDLAKFLSMERATIGKQISACLARGWVRRERDPKDRRRFSLNITKKGEQMLREVVDVIAHHERLFTRSLTDAERLTLQFLLGKLIADWYPQ